MPWRSARGIACSDDDSDSVPIRETRNPGARPVQVVTKSRIDGAFKGWTGRGTYKLVNGQYWQQTTYKYKYKYKYRPVARIWKDGSRYYLEVDGMETMVTVRRVNAPAEDEE
jgi:hypothetical protein